MGDEDYRHQFELCDQKREFAIFGQNIDATTTRMGSRRFVVCPMAPLPMYQRPHISGECNAKWGSLLCHRKLYGLNSRNCRCIWREQDRFAAKSTFSRYCQWIRIAHEKLVKSASYPDMAPAGNFYPSKSGRKLVLPRRIELRTSPYQESVLRARRGASTKLLLGHFRTKKAISQAALV
jgi:hypothetical protein